MKFNIGDTVTVDPDMPHLDGSGVAARVIGYDEHSNGDVCYIETLGGEKVYDIGKYSLSSRGVAHVDYLVAYPQQP